MTILSRSQLEAAWDSGQIHGVGYSIDGEANIEDLLDSLIIGQSGRVTLTSGSYVVTNSFLSDTSNIFLTCQVPGGTPGFLRVSTRSSGSDFTILSSNASDTSEVAWLMIEP